MVFIIKHFVISIRFRYLLLVPIAVISQPAKRSEMKALTIKETGASGRAEIVDIPEPAIRPGYIKVKTVAVALNPSEHVVALA